MARERDTFLDKPLGDEYMGQKRPALKPESLDGADSTVLTIKAVEGVDIPDDDAEGGQRKAVRIDFEETDLAFWPNKSSLRTISEKYGAKPGDWLGERVALIVVTVNNPTTHRSQKSLHVAQGSEFDDLLDAARTRGRRTVKKAAKSKSARGKKR